MKHQCQLKNTGSDEETIKQQLKTLLDTYPEITAEYLQQHAQLATASVTVRQLAKLRVQIKELQQQRDELLSVASQNEALFRRYAELHKQLLKCGGLSDVKRAVCEFMTNDLGLSECVFLERAVKSSCDEWVRVSDNRLNDNNFYFGRLNHTESQLLWIADSGSVALMGVGDRELKAIVVIRSDDPTHFFPQMDTLLITQLQHLLSAILHQK